MPALLHVHVHVSIAGENSYCACRARKQLHVLFVFCQSSCVGEFLVINLSISWYTKYVDSESCTYPEILFTAVPLFPNLTS